MLKKLTALMMVLSMFAASAFAEEIGFSMYHGSRDEKRLCITVDDLKDIEMLQAIFDLSQELNVPMTFFTLGYVIEEKDAELWRAIAESNCEIGNHTYLHESLPPLEHSSIVNTLNRVQRRLDSVLGYHYPMQLMRPPFGNVRTDPNASNMHLVKAVQAAGYQHIVLWDVSQTDPVKCLKAVQNGSILLFHTLEKDLNCLKEILPQLQEQGYEFVTVSEMAGLPPVEISPLAETTEKP